MTKRPFEQYVPPNHPNWTGMTHRTTDEAFGCRRYYAPGSQPRRRIYWQPVVGAALVLLVLAGV